MVIARSLVQALRDAGHTAEIVVTPENRFGRQASAYIATWLTDVGSAGGSGCGLKPRSCQAALKSLMACASPSLISSVSAFFSRMALSVAGCDDSTKRRKSA